MQWSVDSGARAGIRSGRRYALLNVSPPPDLQERVLRTVPKSFLGRGEVERRFRVRRFAGAAVHAQQLSHLRVVHLTDLHVGRMTPMKVQRTAIELTNRQEPHLVAITGDFVGHTQRYLEPLQSIVSSIAAPVVCVLGNHDHWAGGAEVGRALRLAGAEVLSNSHTELTLRRQRVQVVGLDDAYTGQADWQAAVRGLRVDLPSIGLSHIAEEADALWGAGVPLVLAGHTHAGMVTVARLHELAIGRLAGHRYIHGLYGTRGAGAPGAGAVYVGAGVGAAVMPIRLGERSQREVTLFELGCLPGTFREPLAEQIPAPGRVPTPRQVYRRAARVVRNEQRRARRTELLPTAGRARRLGVREPG